MLAISAIPSEQKFSSDLLNKLRELERKSTEKQKNHIWNNHTDDKSAFSSDEYSTSEDDTASESSESFDDEFVEKYQKLKIQNSLKFATPFKSQVQSRPHINVSKYNDIKPRPSLNYDSPSSITTSSAPTRINSNTSISKDLKDTSWSDEEENSKPLKETFDKHKARVCSFKDGSAQRSFQQNHNRQLIENTRLTPKSIFFGNFSVNHSNVPLPSSQRTPLLQGLPNDSSQRIYSSVGYNTIPVNELLHPKQNQMCMASDFRERVESKPRHEYGCFYFPWC
ncbi:hypothetical protein HK096_008473 [Nowakowskiella sp. JEL0078]|nr:hypothetical protein HK096_008473 [Nowakowskiella sp. JEL0078]